MLSEEVPEGEVLAVRLTAANGAGAWSSALSAEFVFDSSPPLAFDIDFPSLHPSPDAVAWLGALHLPPTRHNTPRFSTFPHPTPLHIAMHYNTLHLSSPHPFHCIP